MRIYNLEGIDYIHISEFAELTNRSIQATRHLIADGNSVRKLKAFRDRSRLMIPVTELTGYPFTNQGASNPKEIYHYVFNEDGKTMYKKLCEKCSYSQDVCEERAKADSVVVPEGDK
jgi:hypothetical protein